MKKMTNKDLMAMIMTTQINRKNKIKAMGHKRIKEDLFQPIYNRDSMLRKIKKDIFKKSKNKIYLPKLEKYIVQNQTTIKA